MQTYTNTFIEQSNDHTKIIHEIQFRSSFKVLCSLQSEKIRVIVLQKSIRVSKKLPLALDCRQSKYSLQIFNIFFQFWAWLLQFFLC